MITHLLHRHVLPIALALFYALPSPDALAHFGMVIPFADIVEDRTPGDYQFYVEPAPYREPAEDSYIVHYTKVIVNGFGKEEAWDREIGLKTT